MGNVSSSSFAIHRIVDSVLISPGSWHRIFDDILWAIDDESPREPATDPLRWCSITEWAVIATTWTRTLTDRSSPNILRISRFRGTNILCVRCVYHSNFRVHFRFSIHPHYGVRTAQCVVFQCEPKYRKCTWIVHGLGTVGEMIGIRPGGHFEENHAHFPGIRLSRIVRESMPYFRSPILCAHMELGAAKGVFHSFPIQIHRVKFR